MKTKIATAIFSTIVALISYGQKMVIIDGDKVALRDTLGGKEVLLSYIGRGLQNQDAIWISYDRRPGVDPWIRETNDISNKYSEDNFVKYLKEKGISILGAITTYDNCQCAKCRAVGCPDMYLIHFKIFPEDWIKLKEFYPEIEHYLRKVKFQ